MVAQIFNPTAELSVPTVAPTIEANEEIEIQPLTTKTET